MDRKSKLIEQEILRLEKQQKTLEVEKLQIEIKTHKSIWRNPQLWTAISAVIVAACAIIWAATTGWFTNQNDLLRMEKLSLQLDIQEFKKVKEGIQDSINLYRSEKNLAFDSLMKLQGYIAVSDANARQLRGVSSLHVRYGFPQRS